MTNALGQTIGVVKHTFNVTNASGASVQITINVDFRSSTNEQITRWALSNRIIAFQRPDRSLSVDELKKLDGTTIVAASAGQKMKSRESRIAELVANNVPEKLAIAIVDNPSVLENIEIPNASNDDNE